MTPGSCDRRRVTLIGAANGAYVRDVAGELNCLGYRLKRLSLSGFVARGWSACTRTVVLIACEDSHADAALLALLASQERRPTLALVPGRAWDSEILALCAQFASWPCSTVELELRLATLANTRRIHRDNPSTHGSDQAFVAHNLVGRSPVFQATIARIRKVARSDAHVLITGETGTGKELAARAIHYAGARCSQPFVPVNCGALPDSLAENELFGHARGAFTDAGGETSGLIASAEGGTLFLDEVETMPAKVQIALLRFLDRYEYRPLGSGATRSANVHVIAATNDDLADLTARGIFRRDLYFRLNLLAIAMPPLRERAGDVALLAEHFIDEIREQYGHPAKRLSVSARVVLESYHWPGNVRELRNVVEHSYLVSEGDTLDISTLPGGTTSGENVAEGSAADEFAFNTARARAIARFERGFLDAVMRRTCGNITQAAKLVGKERRTLGRLLKKHGIDRARYIDTAI